MHQNVVSKLYEKLFRKNVGIYTVPRGGSNYIAGHLHYHPAVFSVIERHLNPSWPLIRYWIKQSILKSHGRQNKQYGQVSHVVFNKVQYSERWDSKRSFRPGYFFIFYIRNPLRVYLSRNRFKENCAIHGDRPEWSANLENFELLLTEFRSILDTYYRLRDRYPSFLLGHEYFCCNEATAKAELFNFLKLAPHACTTPENFFRVCGKCGNDFRYKNIESSQFFECKKCRAIVKGCGGYNPLRATDLTDICNEEWKTLPQIGKMMEMVQDRLGSELADYYWQSNYDVNIELMPNELPDVAIDVPKIRSKQYKAA